MVVGGIFLTLLTNYQDAKTERVYAQAYFVAQQGQARLDTAQAMFPFFVLALAFLGLLVVLSVWIALSNSRTEAIANQRIIERVHTIEHHKIVLIAPPKARADFYRQLSAGRSIRNGEGV